MITLSVTITPLSFFSSEFPGCDSHMKGVGMLVVSLEGVNFRILGLTQGVLGKTPLHLAVKVSFRGAREEVDVFFICLCFKVPIIPKIIFIPRNIYIFLSRMAKNVFFLVETAIFYGPRRLGLFFARPS